MLKNMICLGLPLAATLLGGCATTGGSDLQNVVYDTQRRVVRLENSIDGTTSQVTDSTATLTARVNETEELSRRVGSQLEEQQVRIDALTAELTDLKQQLARRLGTTAPPPTAAGSEAVVGPAEVVAPTQSVVAPPATPANTTPAATPPADTAAAAEALWLRALTAFGADNFSESYQLFDQYLREHPDAAKSVDAKFWRANSQLQLGQFQEAITGFNNLRTQHPNSDKVAFSTYNEAIGYARLGQRDRAEQLLQEVVSNYPTSPAAEEARRSLEVLRKQQ